MRFPIIAAMRVLSVSDEVAREVYSAGIRERFAGTEMVFGCGDLQPSYLEYIISMLDTPCLYVPGNHDVAPEETAWGGVLPAPQGGINVDGRVIRIKGLTVAGLGGSIWYNGGKHQYTELQMMARVLLLLPRVLLRRRRDGHPLDVLLTHSPLAGIHDGPRAHRGFQSLVYFVRRVMPRYVIHGHVHKQYRYNAATTTQVGPTLVINTAGYRALEIVPVERKNR